MYIELNRKGSRWLKYRSPTYVTILPPISIKVEADRTELVVTRQNHDPVVIVSLSEWEGMKETLHLLSTPENARHLREAIAQANAGKLVERELIEP